MLTITIWVFCCSYSGHQTLQESFIDWLNSWLWGTFWINYYSFFIVNGFFSPPRMDLLIMILLRNIENTLNWHCDLCLRRLKLKWHSSWSWGKWRNKGLLWNKQEVFKLILRLLRNFGWLPQQKVLPGKFESRLMFEVTSLDRRAEFFYYSVEA